MPDVSTDHFIGRKAEIQTFQRWLDDKEGPWLLYIHDTAEEFDKKGGVGKSWLLHKCADITRQSRHDIAVVTVDFFNVNERDRIFLAQKLITELEMLYEGWEATAFTQAIQVYLSQIASSNNDSAEIRTREEISGALTEDLRRLDTYLEDVQKMLLVIFDTFETIEQNPSIAVLRPSQTFPDTYQFAHMRAAIAGRNSLDWTHPNWRNREQEVQIMALDPFNQQEMQEYIESESVYDIPPESTQASAFYDRTEGRPIIIGLAIDILNQRILNLNSLIKISKPEFESFLVPQVNQLENPLNWVILFMAHVYHRFNIPILECILAEVDIEKPAQGISQEELFKILPRLSFVRQSSSGNNFVLHDEMRRLVIRYCWEKQDPDRRFRKGISRAVIRYYEQEFLEAKNELQRQGYEIEIQYHRMFMNAEDGLAYFDEQFIHALQFSQTGFARLLLQEIQGFFSLLTFAQQCDIRLAEAKLFRNEENPAPALLILQQLHLEADERWLTERKVDLLLEEGRCYLRQNRLPEAADRYTQCLEIARTEKDEGQIAWYLTSLGLIARRRGEFAKALNYYEQSMAIFKRLHLQANYAQTLMHTGTVYRFQGKIEEALRRCKVAWQLRLELFRTGKISEEPVAMVLNNLGQIYLAAGNIVEAERRFQESYDIFLRVNAKSSIAMIYNRLGAVQLAKGELERARAWFVKGQEASKNLNTEQYINSLNKQGRICLKLQQWKEAVTFFVQAIDQSHSLPDYFQETESLIDLADALEHIGESTQAHEQLQEAETIASRENYSGLLGAIEQQRAEVFYFSKDYERAFQHFSLYCQHMLGYNEAGFITAVQKVVDALLGIPKDDLPTIIQQLRIYWTQQKLDKDHPELLEACEEVESLMIQ